MQHGGLTKWALSNGLSEADVGKIRARFTPIDSLPQHRPASPSASLSTPSTQSPSHSSEVLGAAAEPAVVSAAAAIVVGDAEQ